MPDSQILQAAAAGAVVGGIACYMMMGKKSSALAVRSTAASGSVVYESARAVVRILPHAPLKVVRGPQGDRDATCSRNLGKISRCC